MHKPSLILETGLFFEEQETNIIPIIEKYFKIEYYDSSKYYIPSLVGKEFRTSLNLAQRLRVGFKEYDCMSWYTKFRKLTMFPKDTFFIDMKYIVDYTDESDFPMFIRPCSGTKPFSGQVFPSKDKFLEEYNYLGQINMEPELMCMVSPVGDIFKEYRCVFINHQFVDMCQYMMDGKPSVEHIYEEHAVIFAHQIATNPFFINTPNLVVDIAIKDGDFFLLEINKFECSSFYACNLDLIYKKWSEYAKQLHLAT